MNNDMYVYMYTGPVKVQLLTLAAAAISTTIIGSFLALQSVFDDVSVCVCVCVCVYLCHNQHHYFWLLSRSPVDFR